MGKKIENYYLDEAVGEGEYGKVYKATNEVTNELVAIKVIRIEKFKMSPKLEECTINEIKTLNKIQSNEHVVKFIEILKTVNNYYFVYEFCNGGTLERLIKNQGHLSEAKAFSYFYDMLKAFKTLNKHNIMHRDIKPGNILLHNGVIKIADFGFCKPLNSSRDLAQTMLGSPIYMAPEILKGEVYTIKADIWSLGVVLYQMLFGFCPFEEKSIAKLVTLLEQGTVSYPRNINNISTRAEEILSKMLVKDHFKRISWEQLFEYMPNSSPVSSMNTPTIHRDMPRVSLEKRSPLQSNKEILSVNNLTNYAFSKKAPASYQPTEIKKTLSSNCTVNQILNTTTEATRDSAHMSAMQSAKPTYRGLLSLRTKMQNGAKLITDTLTRCKSKAGISLSCQLMRRIKDTAEKMETYIRSLELDKENDKINFELKKTSSIIKEEIEKVKEKSIAFQEERKKSDEDVRQVVQKYVQQQAILTQKDKIIHILEILDFLKQESQTKDYSRYLKDFLLEQYSRRVKSL